MQIKKFIIHVFIYCFTLCGCKSKTTLTCVSLQASASTDSENTKKINAIHLKINLNELNVSILEAIKNQWSIHSEDCPAEEAKLLQIAGAKPTVENLVKYWTGALPFIQPDAIKITIPISQDGMIHTNRKYNFAYIKINTHLVFVYSDTDQGLKPQRFKN